MIRIARRFEASGRSRNGFIMVAALWLLAALATLASVASVYMAQSARALTAFDTSLQSEMLTTAGIELAAYELSGTASRSTSDARRLRFRLSNSEVTVEYMSEAARINLNMAPRAMIAGLFTALGAKHEKADQFADRVVGWRSKPKTERAGRGGGALSCRRLELFAPPSPLQQR